MGYLSCNAESAIATCDPYNWDRKKTKPKTKPTKIKKFRYEDLLTATNSFASDTFLGKGSHGTVYKATLDNGKLIAAVKKTTQSSTIPAENEIEILSYINHPRLVNLLGYCVDSPHHKLLVVEYMPNGSLYTLLHSSPKPPGWTRRVRFALQVAKAVHALHSSNPPVIHRDIKSSNVLIDEKYNARLSDFGLALRGHVEDVRVKCTPPAGTLGYLDPGYLAPGDLSVKSDVFSFGILLLEIISGRNAIDVNFSPPSIVEWAVPYIKRGDYSAICDRRIGCHVDVGVVRNLAVIAARCVRSTAEKRPGMSEVVEGLKLVSKSVHAPVIWSQLRKRVVLVEKGEDAELAVDQTSSEFGNSRIVRLGSKRNSKVSSVEFGSGVIGSIIGERVVRSKSIGSSRDVKAISELIRRRNAGVTVKLPAVRLSKSRSMGVLNGPRLLHYNNNRSYVFEFGVNQSHPKGIERVVDRSKVLIELDEKSVKEI